MSKTGSIPLMSQNSIGALSRKTAEVKVNKKDKPEMHLSVKRSLTLLQVQKRKSIIQMTELIPKEYTPMNFLSEYKSSKSLAKNKTNSKVVSFQTLSTQIKTRIELLRHCQRMWRLLQGSICPTELLPN